MISVIVPVYNMEKYLEKCVRSILNQDYKDIELILVDDGSKDSSPQMCDEFARQDERIKVIHKPNGGQGSARNMALDIAQGEYISFIDSDDWIELDMYTNLVGLLEETGADIAICEDANNEEDGTVKKNHRVTGTLVMTKDEAFSHRFDGSDIVTDSPCNKLYRKELFNDLRFPENRLLEDTALMYLIIDKTKKIVSSEKVGYNIRCDSNSVSRRKYNKKRCDTIITYTEMSDFFASKEEYKKYVPIANAYIAGAIFFNAGEMYGVDFEGKQETEDHIKNCAKELLASGRILSSKNKALLKLISVSPKLFGVIYNKTKKA
mgnify:CR=1 FL=1